MALDLERLRAADDRLWDLSWVAGELKHAWAWRTGQAAAAKPPSAIFSRLIWRSQPDNPDLAERLYLLNPFYMALAELRIARNGYLAWDYRRWLVAEATTMFGLSAGGCKGSFEFRVSEVLVRVRRLNGFFPLAPWRLGVRYFVS